MTWRLGLFPWERLTDQNAARLHPAPTGHRVQTTGMHLFRFVGEQVAETWAAWDTLGMVSQLGLAAPFPPVAVGA